MRQRMGFVLGLLGLSALLAGQPIYAQSAINLRIDRIDTDAFPEVHVFAALTDSQGRALPDLGREQFVLQEDGRNVPVKEVSLVQPDDVELRVVLALDISGSIKPKLDQVKQAARDFVATLKPSDQVALIFFGNQSYRVQEFSSDHNAAINSINGLTPESLEEYTALYNGAIESIRLAADQGGGRRAVVLLTDGKNTQAPGSSSLTLSDAQREAADKHALVYVIGVGPDVSDQDLRLLASSGEYYRVDQPDEVAKAYSDIAEQLRQQYKITFVSGLPPDGQVHTIELNVNVPNLGATSVSTSMQATAPKTPLVRLLLPEQITIGEPVETKAEVFSRNPLRSIDLLIDGQPVVSEPLTSSPWMYSWTPATSLAPGDHQLDVRVTDTEGVQSAPAPQTVKLEASRTPLVHSRLPNQITIGQPAEIKAEVVSRNPLRSIDLLLDGQPVVSEPLTSSPWMYSWTPATSLTPGDHQLDIRVTDTEGVQSAPAPRSVKLEAPPAKAGGSLGGIAAAIVVLLVVLMIGAGMVLLLRRRNEARLPPGVSVPSQPMQKAAAPANRGIQAGELAGAARAMLVVERGNAKPKQLQLVAGKEVHIGRHAAADLLLEDTRVSAQHALIRFLENGFTIIDLGSTNGTRVNGQPISQMRLQHNDRVEVGDAVLVFKQLG